MIIVNRVDKLQDGIVFNRKYRFKNPSLIIKTWYGLKVHGGGKWFRLYFKDKILYNDTIFLLDLDESKGQQ